MVRDMSVLGEHLDSGFAVLDGNGVLTYANDVLCRMLQFPRAALVEAAARNREVPYDSARYRNCLIEQGQGAGGAVMTWRTFAGRSLELVVWPFPLFDPRGVCVGSFALLEPKEPFRPRDESASTPTPPSAPGTLPTTLGSPALSPREREILSALVEGKSLDQAAAAFQISPHTVRNHRKRIYRKLSIRSEAELLRLLFMGKPRAMD